MDSKNDRTALNQLLKREFSYTINKQLIKELFKSGYNLKESDLDIIFNHFNDDDIFLFKQWDKMANRALFDIVEDPKTFKFLKIIESAKLKEISSNYTSNAWVQFANNAISYYHEYWSYIDMAFENYGVWPLIKKGDKKGTTQRLIAKNQEKMLKEPNYDLEDLMLNLYPDAFGDDLNIRDFESEMRNLNDRNNNGTNNE
jgi:hypothetical protein